MRVLWVGTAVAVIAVGCASFAPRAAVPAADTSVPTVGPVLETPTASVTPAGSVMSAEPFWSVEVLGDGMHFVAAAGPGGSAVVLAHGAGTAAWVDKGVGFEPASIERPVSRDQLLVFDVGHVGDRFLATGQWQDSGIPALWASRDGLSWELLSTAELDQPADLGSLRLIDGVVYAVGSLRYNEDRIDPADAAIWYSTDQSTWTPANMEHATAGGGFGYVTELVDTGQGLLALGHEADRPALWDSTDGGATWTLRDDIDVDVEERWFLRDLARLGDDLVAVGEAVPAALGRKEVIVVTSSDGGETFTRQPLDPMLIDGIDRPYLLTDAGGAVWIVARRSWDPVVHADRCYVDIESCQRLPESVLWYSQDGINWAEVDLSGIGLPDPYFIYEVIDRGDQISIVAGGEAVVVASWPASVPPPLLPLPDPLPEPEQPLATPDTELVMGVTYRFILSFGVCQILPSFNGLNWVITQEAPYETRDDWPYAGYAVDSSNLLGFATLIDEATIEYTLADGRLAYVFKTTDQEPPPLEELECST